MSWSSSIRLLSAATVVVAVSGELRAVTEPPPEPVRVGLYEWMGVAPIAIVADIVADDSRFTTATVRISLKGGLDAGATVEIDERQANRDRDAGLPAVDLAKGKAFLLLLQPSTRGKKESYPVFDLTRGVRGAKPLPAEGAAATIEAVTRLAEVQERRNDDYLWRTLPEFLQDSNPLLVDTALDLYLKFRRENEAIAPILQPLLGHPRPDFRRRAVVLMGRVLARAGAGAIPERPQLVAELTGRARRDEDPTVRREATAALAALTEGGVDETLRTIARDDPDQDVRFEAERSLLQRSESGTRKRLD